MNKADAIRQEAERLFDILSAGGAVEVRTDILQPATTLLDLYGEDIRARAFVTEDPLVGEQMLRPDFTVPVVEAHMRQGAEPARYIYRGKVFRRQETDTGRPNEYLQVGYELFDGSDLARADAEVFALVARALQGQTMRAICGDIGILRAAVAALQTTDRRKAALMRHIWRPGRFRTLLERFSNRTPVPEARTLLLAGQVATDAPQIGLRRADEVAARIAALREDAEAAPLTERDMALFERLLAIQAPLPEAAGELDHLAGDYPALSAALEQFHHRATALQKAGVALEEVQFEAAYGRATMEYYDGFVFGFYAADQPDLPALATGGRYDALTRQLGCGREIPAVGAVIRPGLTALLRGAST